MYNYHTDLIWTVNIALAGIIISISFIIVAGVIFKNFLWWRHRRALLSIKKNVHAILTSDDPALQIASKQYILGFSPQQFIDIETNRVIDAVFFNDSEQQFLRSCYVRPEMLSKLEKIAKCSRDKWRRIEALLALGYTQAISSIGILKSSLLNKDKDVAYFSLIALAQIKTVQSARILLDLIRKDPSNGYKIVSILESFPKEIADEVIDLADYYDPLVKYWALTLLSKIDPAIHIKRIEKFTRDETAEVRAAACDCLGNIDSKNVAPVLLGCMKDDSWLVKSHAILAFGKTMGDEALSEVTKLINDASWSVVDAVREVMTDHIEASLPYIERFLNSKDEVAKKCSVMALENSGYLTKLLNTAVSAEDDGFAIRLVKAVIRSRASHGINAAIGHLKPSMRAKALEILENIEEA